MKWGFLMVAALVTAACDSTPDIGSIAIVPGDTLLIEGRQTQLKVMAYDADGRELGEPIWTQTFWSSAGRGLLITDGGWIKAVGYGESMVTAQVEEFTATATVRTNPSFELTRYAAYINQANQNPEQPIALISGRKGLFRLFIVIDEDHYYEEAPDIRVRFESVGIDTVLSIAAGTIPRTFREGDLAYSYNLHMPKETIVPGLQAMVTYDPENRIDGISGSEEFSIEVTELPFYRQTIVPFISTKNPNTASIEWAESIATLDHRDARAMRIFLPVNQDQTEIIVYDPVETDVDLSSGYGGWVSWLEEIDLIWLLDGAKDYYYGAMKLPSNSAVLGIAYAAGSRVGVGGLDGSTLAHEVGHTMSLGHAPCRTPDPDPRYPHPNGNIGYWGYDPEQDILVPANYNDFMGYCANDWVSAYNFNKAMRFRDNIGFARGPKEPVILLWGDIDNQRFEPAFRLTTHSTPQNPNGRYLAEGFDSNGERVFAHRFEPSIIAEYGHRTFLLAIPDDGTPTVSVTVSGPGVAMTLTDGALPRMMIERDTQGRVRAIRRNYMGTAIGRSLISTGLPYIN